MSRVVIIEPSELVQVGLRSALEFSWKYQVVGTLVDMYRYEEKLATLRPDIIIINPSVLEFHSRGQVQSLFDSNVVVVGLAYGFMDNQSLEQYASVIDVFEPLCKIEHRLNKAIEKSQIVEAEVNNCDQEELSEREKEILIGLVKGMTNKEIANLYNISIHTVISHRKNITRKTSIKSLSGLTIYAILNNVIDQSEIQ